MFKRILGALGKDRPTTPPAAAVSIQSLQDEAVQGIVSNITDLQDGEWDNHNWLHIAVNHELQPDDALRSSTQAAVLARRGVGPLEKLNFRLSPATKAKLVALRDAMPGADQKPWTVANITIERDGTYHFAFGYDPPPRINGDITHSPLKDLLERYKNTWGID